MDALLILLFGILVLVRTQDRTVQIVTGSVMVLVALLMYGVLHLPR